MSTSDDELAEKVRVLRLHGAKPKYFHKVIGGNFRLDSLQAALLRAKLPHLPRWTEARKENAQRYLQLFTAAKIDAVTLPKVADSGHVFNQYVLRVERRDELQVFLKDKGISSAIYYPKPLHLQECFADLNHGVGDFPNAEQACEEVLAIPVHPDLVEEDQKRIVDMIADFYTE